MIDKPRTDEDSFDRFLKQCAEALKRISRHSRGEFALEDVRSEVWVMWRTLMANGRSLDLTVAQDQETLIARLYQHLVRYTELNVRNAVRLDHAPGDADEPHPLAHLLSAGEHHDPLVALLEAEQARSRDRAEPTAGESLAGGFVASGGYPRFHRAKTERMRYRRALSFDMPSLLRLLTYRPRVWRLLVDHGIANGGASPIRADACPPGSQRPRLPTSAFVCSNSRRATILGSHLPLWSNSAHAWS